MTNIGFDKEFSPSEVLAQQNSHLEVRDAIAAALPKNVGPQALGYYLDKHVDQVVAGLMLSQRFDKTKKANRYCIHRATGVAEGPEAKDLFA